MENSDQPSRGKMTTAIANGDAEKFWHYYDTAIHLRQANTWLVSASHHGNLNVVNGLLERGIDPNETSLGSVRMSAIRRACGEGHVEVVQRLLKEKVELSVEDNGNNCLFGAIYSRSLPIAKLLVDAEIDIHKTYDRGNGEFKNALSYAVEWGAKDIAEFLRSKGAKLPNETLALQSSISTRDRLLTPILEHFGQPKVEIHETIRLPGTEGEIELLLLEPSNEFPFNTLFTYGLAQHAIDSTAFGEKKAYIELMMHLPFTWSLTGPYAKAPEYQWPLEWMRLLPENMINGNIDLPNKHVIISNDEPPQALGAGTEQTCLMLLADFYPFSPVDTGDSKLVHFYHLIPLYTDEREFEKANGIMPLLQAMAENSTSLVISPKRASFT